MQNVKSNIKATLKDLQAIVGVPGCEQEVIKAVVERIKGHVDEYYIDALGNIIATKKGSKPGPRLMISAHMDEIGFVIKTILPDGFLKLEKVGGVPDNIMLARKVDIGFKKIPGVIGTKPGHLQTPEEAKTVQNVGKCYVDLGASSADEVKAMGIKVGDPVVFHSDFDEMANPDIIATKAIDDRVNCAIIIEMLKNLKSSDFGGTLFAVFTVREEVGLFGAETAAFQIQPDYCINLDTIPAGDTPDVNTTVDLPIRLGKGPGLPVADGAMSMGFFYFIHPAVRRILEETAAEQKINLQQCTLLSYAYTTDSAKIAIAGKGVPTATLTVPRRYSHSPVEVVHMQDATDVYTLIKAVVLKNATAVISFI